MSETITKYIHVRIGQSGRMAAVTDDEVEDGTTLDDVWSEEGSYYDRRIAVTATLPEAIPAEPACDAEVVLSPPADPAPDVPLAADEA